jgi:hypothetical protein
MMFETTVLGIPCIIEVTDWEPYIPPRLHGHPDSWCPGEGGYGDYVILTRRGKPAKLIERKMTLSDIDKLELEIFEHMERTECLL